MDEINNKVILQCPQCKKQFAIPKFDKPGEYKCDCPHCKHRIILQLNPKPIQLAQQKPAAPAAGTAKNASQPAVSTMPETKPAPTPASLPTLGNASPLGDGRFVFADKAIINEMYELVCPQCQKKLRIKPSDVGRRKCSCKQCGAIIVYEAYDPNAPQPVQKPAQPEVAAPVDGIVNPMGGMGIMPSTDEERTTTITPGLGMSGNKSNGKLVWGSFFRRKTYVLRPGVNIIGRTDLNQASDCQLDDGFVSRRSVEIMVDRDGYGRYSFQFSVIHTANPILVNGKELTVGSRIYLNYGDIIKLGNTILTFKEDK